MTEPSRSFSFTNTTSDLLDAHRAFAAQAVRARLFFRFVAILFGLIWACAPLWIFVFHTTDLTVANLVIWLGGCTIVWRRLIRPFLDRRRIKHIAPAEQEVRVDFAESEVRIVVSGGEFVRSWGEFERAVACKKGLLISFEDGSVNWIPARAFAGTGEMKSLAMFIDQKRRRYSEQR